MTVAHRLDDLLRAEYGASRVDVLEIKKRTAGALYRLRLDGVACWLRVGGVCNRSLEHTEVEGVVLAELHRHGVHVQRAIARADGRLAGTMRVAESDEVTIAYREVEGSELQIGHVDGFEAWGHELRDLHCAPCASRVGLPIVEPLVGVQARLELAAQWLTDMQRDQLAHTIREALDIAAGLTTDALCHGDARTSNVRFAAGHATLLDTENLGLGPRTYDLACVWRQGMVESTHTDTSAEWEAFRRGYEADRPLSDREWRAVPALGCLRALWTMTLPAEVPQNWGQGWLADPAYWAAHLALIERLATARVRGPAR